MEGGPHQGAGRPDVTQDEQVPDVPHPAADQDLYPLMTLDQGSQKMAIHPCLCPDPVHLQDDYGPDPAGAERREDSVYALDGTRRSSPHDRPLSQVKTTDYMLEADRTSDLGDLVGSPARLGCQDDASHPDVEETARIRCRTEPRVDQQVNPSHVIYQRCHQDQVVAGLFKGIQIRHVDLLAPEGCVQPLEQDQRIRARREAALHRPIPVPVAAPRVHRNSLPDVDDRNHPHRVRSLARP